MPMVNAEVVCEVFHRLLARRDPPREDENLVPATLLLGRELEQRQCGAADVQSCDRVNDPHAGSQVAHATAMPSVSQNVAAIGVPPKSPSPAIAPSVAANHAIGRSARRGIRRRARIASRPAATRNASSAAAPTSPSSYRTWSYACCGMKVPF